MTLKTIETVGSSIAIVLGVGAWRGAEGVARATGHLARRLARWDEERSSLLEARVRSGLVLGERPGRRVAKASGIAGLATLYWSGNFAFFLCLGRAVLPAVTPVAMLRVFLLAAACALVPVRGLADAGSHELAWSIGLAGVAADRALECAAATHVLVVAVVAAFGAAGTMLCLLPGSSGRGPGSTLVRDEAEDPG